MAARASRATTVRFEPAVRIAGALAPPPDKSISHRAALLAAMSDGPVRITNYLRSRDTAATVAAIHELGADVEQYEARGGGAEFVIRGVGLHGAQQGASTIDVGNAGTLMRLLPGWLAGQEGRSWTLDGDESIRRRPVDRVATPLREMGAAIRCRDDRLPPLVIEGAQLSGIRYELPVASAQVKSCVLLAGLLAKGRTTVVERLPSRDHTEIMLRQAGVELTQRLGAVTVAPPEQLILDEVCVPGDFSSAAFFVAAATLLPGSELTVEAVGLNPTRTGLLRVMERMGASVEAVDDSEDGEQVGELSVHAARLRATSVDSDEIPSLIDELPLVALLGALAEGATVVRGARELRYKESDRIATVVGALRALGVEIEPTYDGFVVEGGGELRGGVIDTAGDHRLAMLGAVAGLCSREGVEVKGFETAAMSYPGFRADLEQIASSG